MNPFLIPRYIRNLQAKVNILEVEEDILAKELFNIRTETQWPVSKYLAYEIVSEEDLPLPIRNKFKILAKEVGVTSALKIKLGPSPEHFHIREFSSRWDAGCISDELKTAPILIAGQEYSIFSEVEKPRITDHRVVVFFAIGIDKPNTISRLVFRHGNAPWGNIIQSFDLAQIGKRGFFNCPIVFYPDTLFSITIVCSVVTNTPISVRLFGYTFEPRCSYISGE